MHWLLALSLFGTDGADVTRDSGREQQELVIARPWLADGVRGFPPELAKGVRGFPPELAEGVRGFPPELADRGFPPQLAGFPTRHA